MLPDEGRDQGGIDRFAELGTADLGQISQRDADDQGGFDPFAQSDDEGLEHLWKTRYLQLVANELQFHVH